MEMKKERIYVCHTYYHVYVTLLREFSLPSAERGKATLVLSKMSNDFLDLKSRAEKQMIFEEVIEFDEKRETFFSELEKYRKNTKNGIKNLLNRMIFTKKLASLEEPFIPVDFKNYREIYVFCDSDPIGYYLNSKRIAYHAMEDGLNCLIHFDAARYDNRGNFKLKVALAKRNLIFIQNGYSKYCIDLSVNQKEGVNFTLIDYKVKEEPRNLWESRLTDGEKDVITNIFVKDKENLYQQVNQAYSGERSVLILTEPLCDLETRERIFHDLIEEYKKQGVVVLKQHPRDLLEYKKLFPGISIIDSFVPMEVMNHMNGLKFDLVVSILTEIKGIRFGKECVRLGPDFMDRYEEPSIHRQNEQC